jgi:hypothetical protein
MDGCCRPLSFLVSLGLGTCEGVVVFWLHGYLTQTTSLDMQNAHS